MPKSSERREILLELDNMLQILAIYDEENTEQFQEVFNLYAQLSLTRFFTKREFIPKSNSMINLMWQYSDKEFKQIARMTKASLIGLLNLIEDHKIFKNESNNKQKEIWIQLLVTLNRLGCEGNGMSIDRNAIFSGISHGTVYLYQERVFQAILSLEKIYLVWPNAEQRIKIKEKFGTRHGLPGCVGIVDGTPINFSKSLVWIVKFTGIVNLDTQLICN